MSRFQAERYREDFMSLTHRVRDTEENMIVDEAMTRADANKLAGAMNSLAAEYRRLALLSLGCEWTSKKCAVCGSPKWANYPFCRSCSIKLQCAHLMDPLKRYCGMSIERISRFQKIYPQWGEHYDRARDFLFAVKRGLAVCRPRRTQDVEC